MIYAATRQRHAGAEPAPTIESAVAFALMVCQPAVDRQDALGDADGEALGPLEIGITRPAAMDGRDDGQFPGL